MRWIFAALICLSPLSARASTCEQPVVAILDTGADPGAGLPVWNNPGETGFDRFGRDKATNGVDDDGNGLIDDVHGWNFAAGTNDLTDHIGHGTHIAGLIGDQAAASTRLMILKYYDRSSPLHRPGRALRDALAYAIKMGVQLIHISGGGYKRRSDEWTLLREAERRGIVVVASSGNKKPGAPDRPFFPAAYGLKNIVAVTATDDDGRVLATSNLIPGLTNVFEKGLKILSLLPGGKRGPLTGTSQAAGVFTGKLLSQQGRLCGLRAAGPEFFNRFSPERLSTN